MNRNTSKRGIVHGVRFEIKDTNTIKIWKPSHIELSDFRNKCNFIIKYLIDEGFYNKTKCRVEVVT